MRRGWFGESYRHYLARRGVRSVDRGPYPLTRFIQLRQEARAARMGLASAQIPLRAKMSEVAAKSRPVSPEERLVYRREMGTYTIPISSKSVRYSPGSVAEAFREAGVDTYTYAPVEKGIPKSARVKAKKDSKEGVGKKKGFVRRDVKGKGFVVRDVETSLGEASIFEVPTTGKVTLSPSEEEYLKKTTSIVDEGLLGNRRGFWRAGDRHSPVEGGFVVWLKGRGRGEYNKQFISSAKAKQVGLGARK